MLALLSRRQFLATGSAFIAAASAGSIASAADAASPKKRTIHKGIMYQTISYKGSVLQKFQAVKEAGFEGVEAMGGMDQEEVLKARDSAGLKIPSVCCHTHWIKTLSDPNPAAREAGLEGLQQSLRDAKAYGASSVLLVPAVVDKKVSYADAYTRSQAEIRKAVPLAEQLGVKIAIENVWNGFLLSPLEAARYVDELNSKRSKASWPLSSRLATMNNGFECSASAFKNSTSRNTAASGVTKKVLAQDSTSNSSKATTTGPPS